MKKFLLSLSVMLVSVITYAAVGQIKTAVTGQAVVKMTYIDYDNPDAAAGEVTTAVAGYNKISGNIVAMANPNWGVNKIIYLNVDISKVKTDGMIKKVTLYAECSGSTDSKRTTGWGTGWNETPWSADMTYETADKTIMLCDSGTLSWTTTKSGSTYETLSWDITDAFARAEPAVTILVYETAAAGGNFRNPYVVIEEEPVPIDPADQAAAESVVTKIEAIGTVEFTEESKDLIDAARAAYNALTESQKELITEEQLKVLTDAEDEYAKLEAEIPITEPRKWDFSKNATNYPTEFAAIAAATGYWADGGTRITLKVDVNGQELTLDGTTKISFTEGLFWTAAAGKLLIGDGSSKNYQCIQTQKGAQFRIPRVAAGDTIKFVGCAPSKAATFTFENTNPATIDVSKGSSYTEFVVVMTANGDFIYTAPQDFRLQSVAVIPAKKADTPNTLTAGYYEITATITANEGVEVPSEMQKYLGGYTAQGELTGDSLELVISTFEEGFILNGFSVKSDAVILNDEAEVVFNGKHFQLADAAGNTNGKLAITKTGEYEYALADGTIVYMGNVVGTVTGITFKMIEDPTTGINNVDTKAVKSGKFLENGKLVIIRNGVKFGVTGQVM